METAGPIVAVGLLVFLAHLFAALYEKTRVPDVVPLVVTGLLLGPVWKFVKVDQFGDVGGVFTTLALVIILFESGLAFRLDSLKKAWFLAGRISLATFLAIVVAVGLVTMHIFGISWFEGMIFGLLLAATSPMAVAAIIAKSDVSEDLKTTMILESTVREVLSIVITLACFNLAKHPELPTAMIGSVISSFVLASAMGIVAAIIWSSLLPTMRYVSNSIFCTPAFVCIVFGVSELLGYSGPLASLAFGTVLGNIEEIKLPKIPFLPPVRASLTRTEVGFFSAIGFLLKTLFFVYLGISMSFKSPQVIFLALVITVWILISRLLIVKFGVSDVLSSRESAVTAFMMPAGLAAAVLASMLADTHMAEADTLRQVAYGVILLTIVLTSLMMFLIEKGYLDHVITYIFPEKSPQARAQAITASRAALGGVKLSSASGERADGDAAGGTEGVGGSSGADGLNVNAQKPAAGSRSRVKPSSGEAAQLGDMTISEIFGTVPVVDKKAAANISVEKAASEEKSSEEKISGEKASPPGDFDPTLY